MQQGPPGQVIGTIIAIANHQSGYTWFNIIHACNNWVSGIAAV